MSNIKLLIVSSYLQINKIDFKLVDALPSAAKATATGDQTSGKKAAGKAGKKGWQRD